jgi:hypothetical protein
MGAVEDPDIDNYYNKSHEFPLTYSYFKDKSKWDLLIALHACILFEHLYETY